ncbi:deoxyribonuclease gamma isoform X2 [Sorex araneus]|uniref:deoxyribonuclease gamma isoform X2 n=1 Tax=Sorex araneus TaxID=42254 RepID=UPI00033183B4|nr:deoxyribonuclease gamma isoform X2 [Sorex araneus]
MSLRVTSLLLLLLCLHGIPALKICSFNVRSFGATKTGNKEVMDIIVKIIKRCDIMLLMEIKDSKNIIGSTLMEKLNGEKLVTVKKTYTYHDKQVGDEDVFSREPFVVWFQSPHTAIKDFVIIPLHTTPENSVKEIDELVDVYKEVSCNWKTENFIFMGDFNAGCSYVPKKAWKNIRLRTDRHFVWLIGDHEDTTVKKSTKCAYDRFVLRGRELVHAVVPKSSSVFDFEKAYGLTEDQALDVSDHFPIEFRLKSSSAFTNNKKFISPKKERKSCQS